MIKHSKTFMSSTEELVQTRTCTTDRCILQPLLHPWFNVYIKLNASSLFYFSFQPVLHDWCNKGRGMCYPVCGMVHIKEPLLLIDKSSLCGSSGFPFSLSEWSLTICLTPYNCR